MVLTEAEELAAWLIDYRHPTENALTRPEDPRVMVRSDPRFFVCRDALRDAESLLASDWLTDLIAARTADTDARLAAVEHAARPLVEYLVGMDAFYDDEPYDTEDVIDTASGDRGDPAALRWSDLRALRAALSAAAPDAGQREAQERAGIARAIESRRGEHWQDHLRIHPHTDARSDPGCYAAHDAYLDAATIARADRSPEQP